MKEEMTISEINFLPVRFNKGLIGFVNFVIDDALKIEGVAVYTRIDGSGYRLVYPKYNEMDVIYPINKTAGSFIEKAVNDSISGIIEKRYS